jgi:DNA polymerase-3 subunit alpha
MRRSIAAREAGGPFTDLFDFCERIDQKVVTRAAIERLIKAGAFDCLGGRATQMHVLPRALQAAGERQEDRRHGQMNFFDAVVPQQDGSSSGRSVDAQLPDIPEWSNSEKLRHEKEALDFYITSHPLAQYESALSMFSSHALSQLSQLGVNQEVVIGGMLTDVRILNTKKARNGHSRYLRCKLEDLSGSVACVMWPDDFARCKEEVGNEQVCFVRGMIERNRDEPGLILSRILSVEQAQRELTKGLVLLFNTTMHGLEHIDAVGRILRSAPGACPVYLNIVDHAGRRAMLKTGDSFRINPATLVTGDLETLLGPGHVKFSAIANGRAG